MIEEIFDVVNDADEVIDKRPRSEVHRLGLMHRGAERAAKSGCSSQLAGIALTGPGSTNRTRSSRGTNGRLRRCTPLSQRSSKTPTGYYRRMHSN